MSVDSNTDSSDTELEVIMITEQILSPKQMRVKLLDFLLHSPPPHPLHWISFRDYIVGRFKTYYSEKVMNDVFHLINTTISKKGLLRGAIDLDSDGDSSAPRGGTDDKDRENVPSGAVAQPLTAPLGVESSHNELLEDVEEVLSSVPLDSSLPQEEVNGFKKHPIVRANSKLFKEMYKLLKEIQENTTCRICSKLRHRLTRFQQAVSKHTQMLTKVAQSEQESNLPNPRKRGRPPIDMRRDALFNKLTSEFMTLEEADKIRQAILTDKLIELSYPDVVASAEKTSHHSSSDETTDKTSRSKPAKSPNSTKSKSLAEKNNLENSQTEIRNGENSEQALVASDSKKRRRKRQTSLPATPDPTEDPLLAETKKKKTHTTGEIHDLKQGRQRVPAEDPLPAETKKKKTHTTGEIHDLKQGRQRVPAEDPLPAETKKKKTHTTGEIHYLKQGRQRVPAEDPLPAETKKKKTHTTGEIHDLKQGRQRVPAEEQPSPGERKRKH